MTNSWFIPTNGTRTALEALIGEARPTDELLAICGQKGKYATAYYKSNFKCFSRVSRVFLYETIRDEILRKRTKFCLDGFLMHRALRSDSLAARPEGCQVNCSLVRSGNGIGDVYLGFDPPLSLGMAIVRSQKGKLRKAVIQWEAAAEAYAGLLDIEGLVIDAEQQSLLQKLVTIHVGLSSAEMGPRNEQEEGDLTVGLVRLYEEHTQDSE